MQQLITIADIAVYQNVHEGEIESTNVVEKTSLMRIRLQHARASSGIVAGQSGLLPTSGRIALRNTISVCSLFSLEPYFIEYLQKS
jgi:hypothetical protein